MASGVLNSTKTDKGCWVQLQWETLSYIAGNYTRIDFKIVAKSDAEDGSFPNSLYGVYASILGMSMKNTSYQYTDVRDGTVLETGYFILDHDDNGKRTGAFGVGGAIGYPDYNQHGESEPIVFDSLKEMSVFDATEATIGSEILINITKQLASTTVNLEYKFGNLQGTIVSGFSGTSYSWEVPTSFYYEMTDTNISSYRLICTTYSANGEYLGQVNYGYTLRANQLEAQPDYIIHSFTDVNPNTLTLTGNAHVFINGHSTARVVGEAIPKYGATIVEATVKAHGDIDGNVITSTSNDISGDLENVVLGNYYFQPAGESIQRGSNIRVTLLDSRGYYCEYYRDDATTLGFSFIDYVSLTCNLGAGAVSRDGSIEYHVSGKFWNHSFGAATNELTLEYRYKTSYGAYGEWMSFDAEPSLGGGYYDLIGTWTGLDPYTEYIFEVRATDKLMTVRASSNAYSGPIFDWGETDFAFNVPVYIQGNIIADHVIARGSVPMGTNGTWYWCHWASGKAECYGTRNFGTMAVSTAFGPLYRSDEFVQEYPNEIFIDTPGVSITLNNTANYFGWIAVGGTGNASQTPGFYVVRPASTNLGSSFISFHAIGRWKE